MYNRGVNLFFIFMFMVDTVEQIEGAEGMKKELTGVIGFISDSGMGNIVTDECNIYSFNS